MSCCLPKEFKTTSPEEDYSRLEEILTHPVRQRIVDSLLKVGPCNPITPQEFFANETDLSAHLKILNEAGILQGRFTGPTFCYCVNENTLKYFASLKAQYSKDLISKEVGS
jgi:hypothetical protein